MLLLACVLILSFLIVGLATFAMWSTYLGMIIFICVAFYGIYMRIKRRETLSEMESLSNMDFLTALEKKENQNCLNKSNQQTGLFISWALGFCLYIYEFILHRLDYLLLGYGALLSFILFVWFFFYNHS